MAGVTIEKTQSRRVSRFGAVLMLAAVLTGLSGCAAKVPCYQVIDVTPAGDGVVVFDACTGDVEVRMAPPVAEPLSPM